jgi:hypothetical protein
MNEELVITALKEIRDDQKKIVQELSEIKTELAISRNGFSPHEIVELLHWVDKSRKKEEKQADNITRAAITWGVPILLSAVFVGLMTHIK